MDPFPFTSLGPRGRTGTPAPSAADAAGHLDLPQNRSCSGDLSLSQHPGQARRRTGPAGRPSRAPWGSPK